MPPPDTPFAALPAAAPPSPPLRAAGRPALPSLRARSQRTLWTALLSLLLHLTLLAVLLLVHRQLREPAVSPSFDVLFQPPGTKVGKQNENKPTEMPAPATPPAAAPPATPTPPTPTPPTPPSVTPPTATPPPVSMPPPTTAPSPPLAVPPTPT
ncbi:MAG: hypothetical protein M0Z28_18680, partial [Rhodospirillales bacterium]|nr:hypothetical protein [Rhodospirillales bacterium]